MERVNLLLMYLTVYICVYVDSTNTWHSHRNLWEVNPLHAKFFRKSKNIYMYLQFMSFLHIHMIQVVEIFPQVRQGPTYST